MNKEEMKGFINTTTDPVTKPRGATCGCEGVFGISDSIDDMAYFDWVLYVKRYYGAS